MTQLAIAEAGPEPDPDQSQWLTPPATARALVLLGEDLYRADRPLRVLEPSAGRGNLIRALIPYAPIGTRITAVEIDPRWRRDLEELGITQVEIRDYLTRPRPVMPTRFDLGITNPPFTNGVETEHLAKMLDECERILALLPPRSLHTDRKYERIWRRFDPRNADRDWYIRQEKRCVIRPVFSVGGGTFEVILLDLSREPGPCIPGWV